MNIADIPPSGLIFSSHIRSAIAANLNKPDVCRDTWARMRQAAGIHDKRHRINKRQVVLLLAIAQYWQVHGRYPTPMERNQYTNSLLQGFDVDQMFATFGDRTYSGIETKSLIESELGITIKEDTLRKVTTSYGVPATLAWRKRKRFTARQVQKIIELVRDRPIAQRKAS